MSKISKEFVLKNLQVGKDYRARGGWKVRIVWKRTQTSEYLRDIPEMDLFLCIHRPGSDEESRPCWHIADGEYRGMEGKVILGYEDPDKSFLFERPADIIGDWVD
jgi:hypothetical protein